MLMAVSIVCDKYFLPSLEIISDCKLLGKLSCGTFPRGCHTDLLKTVPEQLSCWQSTCQSRGPVWFILGVRLSVVTIHCLLPGPSCLFQFSAAVRERSPRFCACALDVLPVYCTPGLSCFPFQNPFHFYSESISRCGWGPPFSLLLYWLPAVEKTDICEPINK